LKQVESSRDQGVSEKTNIKADLYSNKLWRCEKLSIRSKSRILWKLWPTVGSHEEEVLDFYVLLTVRLG
jgi:hypothetical protein